MGWGGGDSALRVRLGETRLTVYRQLESTEAVAASCYLDGPAPIDTFEVEKMKIFRNSAISSAVRSNQVLDRIVMLRLT